ncbi:hypothetical protein A4G29_21055 [Mycobacterium kansasii]|nr:hypothetical protein A4G29_21055 [Mycobacterium kansasii]
MGFSYFKPLGKRELTLNDIRCLSDSESSGLSRRTPSWRWLRAGYRHIDTAAAYRNERETGRAVADSGVPRDQLYVVTTLANPDQATAAR